MSEEARNASEWNAAEWIRLLRENAEQLRKAGVTRIVANGYGADIAPEVPELPGRPDHDHADERRSYGDPLDDPETFGGHLPTYRSDGYARPRLIDDQ